jgi:GWxTD domain-containing protein
MKRNLFGCEIVVLLFCLLCIPMMLTQAKEPTSFRIGLDYACFRDFADTNQSYVEIYYSFNRKELEFVPKEEGWVATVLMQLTILDEQGNVAESRMWNTLSKVNDAKQAETVDFMIIDQLGTNLNPGNYRINLKATDVNSMSSGEAAVDAEIKRFFVQGLQLSDLELAFGIEVDTTVGRFTKADRKILPNPSRVFMHKGGMVYFYAELYNLVDAPEANPEYEMYFRVLDADGKKVKDFGKQTQTKPGNSAVVMSGINIATLAGGEYVLELEAKDKETKKKVYSTKRFVILRELTEEEFAAEEIKRFKQDVTYIASPRELDMFDQLNFSGKRNFMEEFWRKKDPNPETPENEFKMEHYRRINLANLRFSRTRESNDGWNSDMGRIYILYGEPSEIERHPSTRETKPWEQWNYHELQGGAYFIFLDEDGYGVYRLIHSNLRGEVYDTQWEERIKTGTLD